MDVKYAMYNNGWSVDTDISMSWDWVDATSTASAYRRYVYPLRVPNDGLVTQVIEYRIPEKLPAEARTLELPDGAKLIIDANGNYRIEDQDAKVTYKAHRLREFSPHLNASDLLADFVRYVGTLGVRQTEVLQLPIELFINWLVIEAAERDHDPVPEGVTVKQHPVVKRLRRPKCLGCGRFLATNAPRPHRLDFCNPDHASRYLHRQLSPPRKLSHEPARSTAEDPGNRLGHDPSPQPLSARGSGR